MGWPEIRLYELAYMCRLYENQARRFDDALTRLRTSTSGKPVDTKNADHRIGVLEWLRAWGCRHLAKSCDDTASQEITNWGDEWVPQLPAESVRLDQMGDAEITFLGNAFGALAKTKAGMRHNQSGPSDVRFGPTAAAKIMYVVRPNACAPWDVTIRRKLGYGDNGQSYSEFLRSVKTSIERILKEAEKYKITPEQLPAELNRSSSSLPKMIDEYLWANISRKYAPPSPDEIRRWASLV